MIYGENPQTKDMLRELEPFEKSSRCLRSVRSVPKVGRKPY